MILGNLVGTTGYSIILRSAIGGRNTDPIFLSAIMSLAVAIPSIIGLFFAEMHWHLFTTKLIIFYITRIVLTLLCHITNTKALEHTEASIFSFLFNFRLGFAALLGIVFLAEPIVALQLLGGAFVFAAGFVVTGSGTANKTGFTLSILSAVFFATFTAFEKYLIGELGYETYMFPSTIITAGLNWLIVLIGKYPIDKEFLKSRELPLLMGFRCISAYGFTLAIAYGALLSVSTYISSLSCVTTPIAAVFFLKETDALKKKALAGIIAIAGATLIFIATH